MDNHTKIKDTMERLKKVERFLKIVLRKDDAEAVKRAILLLSEYAKWYDYRTPQRELYELKEKEKKEYGNISL
jgi:hypothetical protein